MKGHRELLRNSLVPWLERFRQNSTMLSLYFNLVFPAIGLLPSVIFLLGWLSPWRDVLYSKSLILL